MLKSKPMHQKKIRLVTEFQINSLKTHLVGWSRYLQNLTIGSLILLIQLAPFEALSLHVTFDIRKWHRSWRRLSDKRKAWASSRLRLFFFVVRAYQELEEAYHGLGEADLVDGWLGGVVKAYFLAWNFGFLVAEVLRITLM